MNYYEDLLGIIMNYYELRIIHKQILGVAMHYLEFLKFNEELPKLFGHWFQ